MASPPCQTPIVFLKLGGSLITEKRAQTRVARTAVIDRLMREIQRARQQRKFKLLLAHGAGSYGHIEAKQHGTRDGVRTETQWRGFLEVQAAVHLLHDIVLHSARGAGLPVMSISPSSSAMCKNGSLVSLACEQIQLALDHDLVPMLHGDVAFDLERGGTVISTEEIFSFLASKLSPFVVLVAGIEDGVLSHWPNGTVIPSLPLQPGDEAHVSGSHAADVTGGMKGKLQEARAILRRSSCPEATVLIFSGEIPDLVGRALTGESVVGTRIVR